MALNAVFDYMLGLVESQAPAPADVGSVAWLPDISGLEKTAGLEARAGATEQINRLAAIDALHAEEDLLYEGRIWLLGRHESETYRLPLVRRPVSRRGALTSASSLAPVSGWTLTGAIQRQVIDSLDLPDLAEALRLFPPDAETYSRDRYPRLYATVDALVSARGLPPLEIHTTFPDDDAPLRIVMRTGYFIDRSPFQLDRRSVLRLWKAKDLSATALGSLYAEPDGAPAPNADPTPVRIMSPLPLNQEQRRAVEASNADPLTVVSGPPGTGKSHLVAAAAINAVAQGSSVLVATQSVHARDVISEMLARHPSVESFAFGEPGSARRLGDRLSAGVPPEERHRKRSTLEARLAEIDRDRNEVLAGLHDRLDRAGRFDQLLTQRNDIPLWLAQLDVSTIDLSSVRSAVINLTTTGAFAPLRRWRARRRLLTELGPSAPRDAQRLAAAIKYIDTEQTLDRTAGRPLGLPDAWDQLESLDTARANRIGDLLEAERRDRATRRSRGSLGELAAALRQGSTTRRQSLAALGDQFLDVAPLWLGTLGEIEAILPTQPGLFDLVILDEASQISQLSAVPALARAKRAMVVGDSRQLRHVSFISNEAMKSAATTARLSQQLTARLNDRTNSLFDAAASVAATVELDEHFRSAPHIIGFSDRTFYGNRLRLMTQHPADESRDAIEVVAVSGARNEANVIEAEVAAVLAQMQRWIDAGITSIGATSPFRAQADAIEAAVLSRFALETIERHRLRVGTVHSFQGSERSHVVISLGLGPSDGPALRFVEDPALFNVMVTRARTKVVVVTALNPEQTMRTGSGLVAQYFRHEQEAPLARQPRVHASGWTDRLASELAKLSDERVITDYEVAGDAIDIVLGEGPTAIGIETELHPDGIDAHIERHLALRRAGWNIVPLFRCEAFGHVEEAIAELVASRQGR